jgi:hypothetical protein
MEKMSAVALGGRGVSSLDFPLLLSLSVSAEYV